MEQVKLDVGMTEDDWKREITNLLMENWQLKKKAAKLEEFSRGLLDKLEEKETKPSSVVQFPEAESAG